MQALHDRPEHVSSHAPVRGHHIHIFREMGQLIVSSHAPVRGHRRHDKGLSAGHNGFKSCPREGASTCLLPAPAHSVRFKSCPREGASAVFFPNRNSKKSFKSCPREGASGIRSTLGRRGSSFKSCPREGASPHHDRQHAVVHVSSHAPVRGHPSFYVFRRANIFLFQVMPP